MNILMKKPDNYFEIIKTTREKHKFTLGVFYRTQRPTYQKELYGDHNPIKYKLNREVKLDKIKEALENI